MIKLSTWAKRNNVCYRTAWLWVHNGKFPQKTFITETGSIFVIEDEQEPSKSNPTDNGTVIYCRVSNHSRKDELNYQVDRCKQFALANGWTISSIQKEIASGMNDNRPVLWKVIESAPSRILVENKDRLTRFGFNYLKRLLKRQGTEIVVINEAEEDREDLIKDLCSVIYSFCARLYGLRKAVNKAKKIREEIKSEVE